MEFAIGVTAATAVGLFATVIGFDKERSFYPVVLIVIAALYLLFAVMASSPGAVVMGDVVVDRVEVVQELKHDP